MLLKVLYTVSIMHEIKTKDSHKRVNYVHHPISIPGFSIEVFLFSHLLYHSLSTWKKLPFKGQNGSVKKLDWSAPSSLNKKYYMMARRNSNMGKLCNIVYAQNENSDPQITLQNAVVLFM